MVGRKGSSGSAGVDLADVFSRVGGRRASGGSSGRGVVGAGEGICPSYIVDRGVVARESVDFLGFCRMEGGLDGGASASSELELRRDRSDMLEGCECSARCRRSEAVDLDGWTLGIDSGSGGGSNGRSFGDDRGWTKGTGGAATEWEDPSRGESRGVWGTLGTREGRPAETTVDGTGLRLYFEVGGRTEGFRVEVNAAESSICPSFWSGRRDGLCSAILVFSSAPTEIFSSTEPDPEAFP